MLQVWGATEEGGHTCVRPQDGLEFPPGDLLVPDGQQTLWGAGMKGEWTLQEARAEGGRA